MVAEAGDARLTPMVGRGAAYADFDHDGDLDVLVTANRGRARLLENHGATGRNVLRVRTVGTTSNRDGIGARVELSVGGDRQWQIVKTGSSYASQSELPLTFGLGSASTATDLRVTWPGGRVDEVGSLDANQAITVEEGTGIVERAPIAREQGR
jgi:hypothetical protein